MSTKGNMKEKGFVWLTGYIFFPGRAGQEPEAARPIRVPVKSRENKQRLTV